MPNLWEKTPEARSPELNPLTNPILERNLGRWARVYFSTAPANREQAVSELLEQIKLESGDGTEPGRPYFVTDPKFLRAVCSACDHHNPPGHQFCSGCGQTLNPEQPASPENRTTTVVSEVPAPSSANDTDWLLDHTFSGLTDAYSPRKRGWKYATGAAVIVLAALGYMRWAPNSWTKISFNRAPEVSAPATPLPPRDTSPDEAVTPKSVVSESVAAEKIAQRNKEHETANRSANVDTGRRKIVRAGVQSASQKSALLDASHHAVVDQGSSDPDLRLAQRYLGGSMGVREPAEAAKLLWKAVSKQNGTAAVLLSELYARGDGVTRSCDQARLLLVAAAKRGFPLAAQQLRNLESQGCR